MICCHSVDEVRGYIRKNLDLARRKAERILLKEAARPEGFEHLGFAEYEKTVFGGLVIDMRGSTKRAEDLGPERTFYTDIAYLPTVAWIVRGHHGFIINYPGDGAIVMFDVRHSHFAQCESEEALRRIASATVRCALDLASTIRDAVNPELGRLGIPSIKCGIGVELGKGVVTQIEPTGRKEILVRSDGLNRAAKICAEAAKGWRDTQVLAGPLIQDLMPKSSTGRIEFEEGTWGEYKAFEVTD